VMAAVHRAIPSLPVRAWTWLREPWVVAVSPIRALALAAGVAGIALVAALSRQPSAVGRQPSAGARPLVTFVLLAPDARSVALAGDFNDWDASRVLMRREASGLWTVDVPLTPGRYRYVFVVDGRRFVADPAAPRAVGDDFGTPTSVVTVGGGAVRAAGGSL
jgi:endonuclease/exonuclease/phosphatase (EEP) superfamily protein YafD